MRPWMKGLMRGLMRGKNRREEDMRPPRGLMLTRGTLTGLACIQKYRFLTIPQFARTANFSIFHARDVLRTLEGRGALGFFGYVSIPGQGRTPNVSTEGIAKFVYLCISRHFGAAPSGAASAFLGHQT